MANVIRNSHGKLRSGVSILAGNVSSEESTDFSNEDLISGTSRMILRCTISNYLGAGAELFNGHATDACLHDVNTA